MISARWQRETNAGDASGDLTGAALPLGSPDVVRRCPGVAAQSRPLLRLLHQKRSHQHRQRHFRRLPPIQHRLHDLRRQQRCKPLICQRLLEPLAVRAYAAENAPNKTRKCHMDTQTRDQTTRLKPRLMARSESTTQARISCAGEMDVNPSWVRGWRVGVMVMPAIPQGRH